MRKKNVLAGSNAAAKSLAGSDLLQSIYSTMTALVLFGPTNVICVSRSNRLSTQMLVS
jgi:hypothetical protein